MTEPLTPSLRAEPLLIVAPSGAQARFIAAELRLRPREWSYVDGIRRLHGRRGGRYLVYSGDNNWKDGHIEALSYLEMPFLTFVQLPYGRVRKLVMRDRAAEAE